MAGAFCLHCGAALLPGSAFCGRCGAPVAAAAAARYWAPPPHAGALHPAKLSHASVIVAALSAIAVVATLVTLLAVRVSTSAQGCGFYCAPDVGQRLADSKEFVDTKWGFVVDYSGSNLTLDQGDPRSDSVDFLAQDQNGGTVGEILISAEKATSPAQAAKAALGDFPSDEFQDITEVEAVPGAEIGLIPGDGTGYTANLVSTAGSSGNPVAIVTMAATHGNVTIVAAMWSASDTSGDAPFYLAADQSFDYVLTNLHFQAG